MVVEKVQWAGGKSIDTVVTVLMRPVPRRLALYARASDDQTVPHHGFLEANLSLKYPIALVDHSAHTTSTGWKNRRVNRA